MLKQSTLWSLLFLFCQLSYAQSFESFTLLWSDEFDGATLDLLTWNVEVNGLGGYNNELQYYTDRNDNVKVENGHLIITALKENFTGPLTDFDATEVTREYTSARINSNTKREFKHGIIETKIKLPYGNGVFPAFWLMGTDVAGWPANGEIDVMELVGGTQCEECGDDKIHANTWYDNSGAQSTPSGEYQLSSGKYGDAFHTFAIEWSETTIKWFVDGNEFHSVNISDAAFSEFHNQKHILLNFAVGGDWPGSPDEQTVFPQEMLVDYVRVYQQKEVLSIDEAPFAIDVKLYPNPLVGDDMTIELSEDAIGSIVKVTSLLGREIMSYLQNQKVEQLNFSKYGPGIYIVSFWNKKGVSNKAFKVIKN